MAKLDYITIRGFKNIAAVEKLELRPINVVIGSNGAGKSNFIGVFAFLHAIRNGSLQDYVAKAGGADRILYFGSKTTDEIYLRISFDDERNQYEIKLAPTQADTLIPTFEAVYFWGKAKTTLIHTISFCPNLAMRQQSVHRSSQISRHTFAAIWMDGAFIIFMIPAPARP